MSEFTHEDLLQWYRARDVFLRMNFTLTCSWDETKQTVSRCNHPDAKWLFSVIGNIDVYVDHEIIERISNSENSFRAKTFAGYLIRRIINWSIQDEPDITEAANNNYPFACGLMANHYRRFDEGLFLRYAQAGVDGEDPQSLYLLGLNQYYSRTNISEAKELFRKASELGWVKAQHYYAKWFLDKKSEEYYAWLIEGYKNGYPLGKFFTKLRHTFENYVSSWKLMNTVFKDSLKEKVFAIGKVLSIESGKGTFNRPFGGFIINVKEMEIIDAYVTRPEKL